MMRRGHVSVVERTLPQAFHLAAALFRLQAALAGARRGAGGMAGFGHPQGFGQAGAQAFEGQGAVAGLGALVAGNDPDGRSEALEEPRPLPGTEGSRQGDVEANLGFGVGGVGVLAARSAGPGEAPFELVERDGAGAGDTQSVRHNLTVVGAVGAGALPWGVPATGRDASC